MVRSFLLLWACGCGAEPTPESPVEDSPTGLSAREQLVRASIDLRGVRPSVSEIDSVCPHADSHVSCAL